MDALSDLALEVTEGLGDRAVELRLEAGEVRPVVSLAAGEEEPATAADEGGGGGLSRITLRLAETLKAQAEQAAANEGVSLNTWLNGAVKTRLRESRRDRHAGGTRLRGWVQS
jgi:hypothetical protein